MTTKKAIKILLKEFEHTRLHLQEKGIAPQLYEDLSEYCDALWYAICNLKGTSGYVYVNVNCCVCCGAIIPEGRQVCPNCERTLTDAPLILKPVDTLRKEKN